MSHALHRYGTVENLQNDYTMYARTSRFVNREGCGPKLRKILDIMLSEGPVNLGSSHSGRSLAAGLSIKEYADSLDKAYGVACCFSSKEKVKNVLRKLKEADLGISIVVSGLIDEIREMAAELGLKPHTALISLGIHGEKALTPEERILEISTMCGHSLVSFNLTKSILEDVKSGKMAPEKGANLLALPCPCGIFNVDRCEVLLDISKKE